MKKWYDVSATLQKTVSGAIEANSEEEALQMLLVNQEFDSVVDAWCDEIDD
ncbi:hypothetical protein [Lysinibacillus sphaericus]|uniref:hypothetical protein n=1 Tax=Lysinibacillus sphaericus TaxID=1421 RepID=UPI001CBFB202|nr:hypothetical protein [Lysinibacillus sphaericus]